MRYKLELLMMLFVSVVLVEARSKKVADVHEMNDVYIFLIYFSADSTRAAYKQLSDVTYQIYRSNPIVVRFFIISMLS